jgi:hypothetical protein
MLARPDSVVLLESLDLSEEVRGGGADKESNGDPRKAIKRVESVNHDGLNNRDDGVI